MNENLSNQLAALAAKLNVSVDALYAALLKQALIDGLCTVFVYLVIAFCGYLLLRWWKKWKAYKKANERKYDDDGQEFALYILSGLWIVLAFVCLCVLPNTVAAFLNPDYWALHQILSIGKRG